MRLIPAEAGKFKHGQVYVNPVGNMVVTHSLNHHVSSGAWQDGRDGVSVSEERLASEGWFLLDPSDDPEPKRDEFWEKCYLAALTGFCVNSESFDGMYTDIAYRSARQADACVAERKSSGGAM